MLSGNIAVGTFKYFFYVLNLKIRNSKVKCMSINLYNTTVAIKLFRGCTSKLNYLNYYGIF